MPHSEPIAVHDNLSQFLRQRPELFPFRRDLELRQFLTESAGRSTDLLPTPAKIFLLDEVEPRGYGFPVAKSPVTDDLEKRLEKWLETELEERGGGRRDRKLDALRQYVEHAGRVAKNAAESSVLADYESVFWLLHTQQTSRLFTTFVRNAMNTGMTRDEAERLRWMLHHRWATAIRDALKVRGFLQLVLDNPLVGGELFVSADLHEIRGFVTFGLHRDFAAIRKAFEDVRLLAATLLEQDRMFRRSVTLLGYPDSTVPSLAMILDRRVRQLLAEHPKASTASLSTVDGIAGLLLEHLLVIALRRGIIWMKTTPEGENVAEDGADTVYSRAIRPMNFGRRGVVEPIVYRYGLVYDITSFTETLGEIARGGKGEEQTSYRQMIEFQRELADITRRHALQFEKFLGDGAFYTSRRAMRTLQTGIEIQRFYARARAAGFAFNRGMRIALNYGYYRLLPMQTAADGSQIMEFYGPGIVELSRLTTGKTTKELEDLQHLLLSHGYDSQDVYRFFAPLARGVEHTDVSQQHREFYAYVNENGHLINEGIVCSIPFVRQLSTEIVEDRQKLYRLRAPWSTYIGVAASTDGYIGLRLLGSVSLKGIGMQDIGEVVFLASTDADVSVVDEDKPLLQLLQQERNRSAARKVSDIVTDVEVGIADLVVCAEQNVDAPTILVGEWDPVSEEVRRPIRLDGVDAERYGLAVPLTMQNVESHTLAYQKLYRTLSRIETLPSFSAQAVRHNDNFSGFIIGATVEPL
jgi:hypothetical protein